MLNAIPASNAAIDICSLASTFFPSWNATGRYLKIRLIADNANVSDNGCASLDVYASAACVSASNPVAAVIFGGAVIVNCGSMIA